MNAAGSQPDSDVSDGLEKGQYDPGTKRALWRRASAPLLLAVVAAFAVVALRGNWEAVRSELALVSVWNLVLAGVPAVGGLFVAWGVWHIALRHLGGRVRPHPSQVMFFAAQTGKYMPGSVWPAVIATKIGRANQVPRSTVLGAYFLQMVFTVATGGLLAPLLLLSRGGWGMAAITFGAFLGGIILIVLTTHPRGLHQLTEWLSRRTGRAIPSPALPASAVVPIVGVRLTGWVVMGLHIWLLARPLGAEVEDFVPFVGAYAVALVAGLLVVPLPAGAGVREAILMIALEPAIGRPAAISVAILSRFVIVVIDLLVAGAVGVPQALRVVRRGEVPT